MYNVVSFTPAVTGGDSFFVIEKNLSIERAVEIVKEQDVEQSVRLRILSNHELAELREEAQQSVWGTV